MGVDMVQLAAPRTPTALSPAELAALVADLLDAGLVGGEHTLHGGWVGPDDLDMGEVGFDCGDGPMSDLTVHHRGTHRDALLAAIEEFPHGTQDLVVEWPRLGDWYDGRVVPLALVATLTEERLVQIWNAYVPNGDQPSAIHPVRSYVQVTGRHIPDMEHTPLYPVLKRHFGADLIVDCSYM